MNIQLRLHSKEQLGTTRYTALHQGIPRPFQPLKRRHVQHQPHAISAAVLQDLVAAASTQHPGLAAGAAVNSLVFITGINVLLKGLTVEGVLNSWLLGTAVYSAFGPGGYLLVCLYFIFGTLVTKIKLEQKQKENIAEARSGRRSSGSVWGSGSAGTACAVLALLTGRFDIWQARAPFARVLGCGRHCLLWVL
eukprot:jgi/Chrzof1/2335/Cz11g11120.t1